MLKTIIEGLLAMACKLALISAHKALKLLYDEI